MPSLYPETTLPPEQNQSAGNQKVVLFSSEKGLKSLKKRLLRDRIYYFVCNTTPVWLYSCWIEASMRTDNGWLLTSEIFSGFSDKIFKSLISTNTCFLLLPYTEFISWTNRLRNARRIPNHASPVPFAVSFILLLGTKSASHLLLSSLYHTGDLHLSWDKTIHPSLFVLLSYM